MDQPSSTFRHLIKWLTFCYFSYHRKKILPLAESPSSLDLNLCLTGFVFAQTLNCLGAYKSRGFGCLMIGAVVAYSHKPDISMCVEQPYDCDWQVATFNQLVSPTAGTMPREAF